MRVSLHRCHLLAFGSSVRLCQPKGKGCSSDPDDLPLKSPYVRILKRDHTFGMPYLSRLGLRPTPEPLLRNVVRTAGGRVCPGLGWLGLLASPRLEVGGNRCTAPYPSLGIQKALRIAVPAYLAKQQQKPNPANTSRWSWHLEE